jgi:PAS domain-containing protein
MDFAHALLCGNAERMMCTTYTRKLAQKKANALLQRMPSAVVIVDEDLKIIERNPSFTRLFPPTDGEREKAPSSALSQVLPFANLFRRCSIPVKTSWATTSAIGETSWP